MSKVVIILFFLASFTIQVLAQEDDGYSDFCKRLTQNVIDKCKKEIQTAHDDNMKNADRTSAVLRLNTALTKCIEMGKTSGKEFWKTPDSPENGECITVCNKGYQRHLKVNSYAWPFNANRQHCIDEIAKLKKAVDGYIVTFGSGPLGGTGPQNSTPAQR